MSLFRSLSQLIREQVLPAPLQAYDFLADILFQPTDQVEFGESLFFELAELRPTFSRQKSKSRIDAVLESGRNVLAIFAHGGALFKKGLNKRRLQEPSSREGDSLPNHTLAHFELSRLEAEKNFFSAAVVPECGLSAPY